MRQCLISFRYRRWFYFQTPLIYVRHLYPVFHLGSSKWLPCLFSCQFYLTTTCLEGRTAWQRLTSPRSPGEFHEFVGRKTKIQFTAINFLIHVTDLTADIWTPFPQKNKIGGYFFPNIYYLLAFDIIFQLWTFLKQSNVWRWHFYPPTSKHCTHTALLHLTCSFF